MRQLKISKSITNRESASLDRYLSEIGKKEMVTAEEESQLARRIREGDQEALIILTTANLRFVVSVAKQYQNQGLSLPDLINEGNIGLMKAAGRFDETRGFKFISYAVWWIRQGIMQAIAEQSRIIRLPLNKIGALNKIKKTQAILEQDLERPPTTAEIAESLEVSETEIRTAIASSVWHLSTESMMPGNDFRLGDVLEDVNSEQPDAEMMQHSKSTEIQRSLNTLTEREKEVLELFYGIGTKRAHSLDEIAKVYDLTPERVRQIKEKAIRRLRHSAKSKNLKAYLG
jgi:RNA polymerase primary sigma factor